MAQQDINFLAKQQRIVESREEKDRQSTYVLIGVAVVAALIYGGVWYANYYLTGQIGQVQAQITDVQNQIMSDSGREEDYLIFYERLSKLAELLTQRQGGTQSLADTYEHFLTANTSLTSASYSATEHSLRLTLVANSVFGVDELIGLLQDPDFRRQYQSVTIGNLASDSNGTYNLQVTIGL